MKSEKRDYWDEFDEKSMSSGKIRWTIWKNENYYEILLKLLKQVPHKSHIW